MKKTLILLVLLFSSSVFAEDISDFEIEGMSIGDSLLNHFSKNEIANAYNYDHLPSSMKFRIIDITSASFNLYEMLQFFYKPNDKDYIVYSVGGLIFYDNNIDECYKKQLEVVEIISDLLLYDEEFMGPIKNINTDDKSEKSTYTSYYIDFKSGGTASIQCYDWSNEVEWYDNFRVTIVAEEADDWINSNYGLN